MARKNPLSSAGNSIMSNNANSSYAYPSADDFFAQNKGYLKQRNAEIQAAGAQRRPRRGEEREARQGPVPAFMLEKRGAQAMSGHYHERRRGALPRVQAPKVAGMHRAMLDTSQEEEATPGGAAGSPRRTGGGGARERLERMRGNMQVKQLFPYGAGGGSRATGDPGGGGVGAGGGGWGQGDGGEGPTDKEMHKMLVERGYRPVPQGMVGVSKEGQDAWWMSKDRRKMRGLETAYLDMKTLDLKDKEQVTTLGIRQQFGVRAVVSAEEGGSELSEEFLEMQRRLELRVLLQQQQQHCQYEAGTRQQKGAGADAQRAGRGQSAPGGDASSTSSSWKEESDALAPLVTTQIGRSRLGQMPRRVVNPDEGRDAEEGGRIVANPLLARLLGSDEFEGSSQRGRGGFGGGGGGGGGVEGMGGSIKVNSKLAHLLLDDD